MATAKLVQMCPDGSWKVGGNLPGHDEKQLNDVVSQLVKSQILDAARTYCKECNTKMKNKNYLPIIFMPVLSTEGAPDNKNNGDMPARLTKELLVKNKIEELTSDTKSKSVDDLKKEEEEQKKKKKSSFSMNRLTDFDLLSQW